MKYSLSVLLLALLVSSCRKSQSVTAAKATGIIAGTWMPDSVAKDENNNGVREASETYNNHNDYYYFFDNNGTGKSFFINDLDTSRFNWSYTGNGQYLHIVYYYGTPGWPLIDISLHIDYLTANSLSLQDTGSNVRNWLTYWR